MEREHANPNRVRECCGNHFTGRRTDAQSFGVWSDADSRARDLGSREAAGARGSAVLRKAFELGVNFIDTADSYGPNISEQVPGQTDAGSTGVAFRALPGDAADSGTSSVEHFEENLGAVAVKLSPEEMAELGSVRD